LIVKQSIGVVPGKIFARVAAGTGTISEDEISPPIVSIAR
jgi:hypothetical protein